MENLNSWKELLPLSLIPILKSKTLPESDKILEPFRATSLDSLKCVMIGQSPYPQKGVATGLLFGNDKPPLSPSLKELERWIQGDTPDCLFTFDHSMRSIASQGVLLLNSSLTLFPDGSMQLLEWNPFLIKLLQNISKYRSPLVYILFGTFASSFRKIIPKNNHIFVLPHPSGILRRNISFSTDVFDKANECLIKDYGEKIQWYEIPEAEYQQEGAECQDPSL